MTFPELPLKRFGRIVGGATPSADERNWSGPVTWYTPTDVSAVHGGVLGDSGRTLTEEGAESCATVRIPAGSVVFTSRAPIGNVALTTRECTTNQGCKTLVPRADVDPRFVRYAGLVRLEHMRAAGTGTTFQEVSAERLGAVTFPFPDGASQNAIADFLDRECARLAEIWAEVESALKTVAEELRSSVDHRTAELRRVRLRFALKRIEQGWSPQCDNREAGPDEWGVLKLGCVNGGRFVDEHKALPLGVPPRAELEVAPGDVLMSRANTRDLVGSCALVERCRPRLMLSDLLYRLVVDSIMWEPSFVVAALNAHAVRGQIAAAAAGSAGSMPKLNHELVKNLTIPKCSVEEQREVLRRIEQDRERPARLGIELHALLEGVDAYRDSLITEAVTGKLDVSKMSEARMEENLQAVREGEAPEVLTS
ncbi:restriction endonuclease subunit S [Paraconexibacter algicola]|uniref:Type I restriction modification DNA specificity domain-containing protein n=1 Tax=Paraconexibacter algicola TaxID=2133960 RepID=A0A2T4UEC4_9ACTN|nr:restriction endonuclease subunit S [Paraconexibacter algicola]PTL56139.1 hypothetical protein C7Y72_14185 [Paraconexibacter algicola]